MEKMTLLGRTKFNPPITEKNFTIETTVKFDKNGQPTAASHKLIKRGRD